MRNFTFLLVLSLFFSCDKKQEDTSKKQIVKPLLSVVKKHKSVKKINFIFRKEIEDWQDFQAVDNFILRFQKASPNEALSNALELKGLTRTLKDAKKPTLFTTNSFTTRLNILYNEALRLADMTFIPAIKAEEVNEQTEKVLEAFSAVNSKINSILSKKRFEDAIDVDVSFIGLDSTKIDSVSKKTVKSNFVKTNLKKKSSLKNKKILKEKND